jgi:hypothetical protein
MAGKSLSNSGKFKWQCESTSMAIGFLNLNYIKAELGFLHGMRVA